MKVVFSNPATRIPVDHVYERFCIKAGSRWPWSYVKKKTERACVPPFPFYLAYSAALLKEAGLEIDVIDGVALDLQDDEMLARLIQASPDIIVSETTTHSIEHDTTFYKKVKNNVEDVKVVFTGPHASIATESVLQKDVIPDFVIVGEYDFALHDLVCALNENKPIDGIKALAYRNKDGSVHISRDRYPVEPLDDLPMPLYDYFPEKGRNFTEYYGDGQLMYKPGAVMHSTRGCPFGCDFCVWTQVMYGNRRYRMFNPQRVVNEMEFLFKKYKVKEIYFDDDDFCINKKHVLAICAEIKKRKLDVKWSVMGDAMACDLDMVKAMNEAGCISMKFGVESGNAQILKNIDKPLDLNYLKRFAKGCWDAGLFTHATFSLGLTGETRETLKDTLRIALDLPYDTAQVSIATPFPGTRFYDKMVAVGAIDQTDWSDFDGTITAVVSQNDVSPEFLEQFKKRMILKMMLRKLINPRWILRWLKRERLIIRHSGIGSLFGLIRYAFRFFFVRKKAGA